MLSLKIFFNRKKYFASAFFYASFSLLFSTWATYIPYIADKINITEGKIGKAIFFAALGSFFMIPICNQIIDRVGVGRTTFFALCFCCLAIFGPFVATSYLFLCISLFILGMATCSLGISINLLTSTIEKADNVRIMSGSHGFFSAGGMIGAFTGSVIAAWLHNSLLHITLLVCIILCIQIYFRKEYYSIRSEHIEKQKRSITKWNILLITAAVALIIMVSEGAIADWSSLYLKKIVRINLVFIGFGYAGFSLAMTIGRFLGDWISKKMGSWKLLASGSLLSLFGFTLVLVPESYTSIAGFTIVWFGFSVIVPEIYRIASNIKGVKPKDGVSFIAASANIGFMFGPVFLGFLAELRTLHFSFVILSFFVSLAFIISLSAHLSLSKKLAN
jgi:predicted MFS family arabinose efflux permease